MACAPSEDSDQPGHPPSLIRVFAVCLMGSQGPKLSSSGHIIKYLSSSLSLSFFLATSRENVSLGIFDQVRFKPACSATETS